MAELYHVAQVAPARELLACASSKGFGFSVFHPTRVVTRRQKHVGPVQTLVPVIPGYIFVRFDPHADHWRPLCTARGITRLLGPTPETPEAVPDAFMDTFIQAYEAGKFDPAIPKGLTPGDRARIIAGAYIEAFGQCLERTPKRIRLALEGAFSLREISLPIGDVVAA